ncbi:MAG: ATP-binding protein [bacterium]|nr:ATP-binding protein [bacterium]
MKNLPIGVRTFRYLIEKNYLYVDKTRDIYNLFSGGGKYYFLSRPRRFGKSLLISTLAEIFSGSKELFKGLWIYDKIKWTQHPVVRLDFSKITHTSPEVLEKALDAQVEKIAADNHIELNHELFLKKKFGQLLEKLSQKQDVVILIDEYDNPVIEYMEADKIEIAKKNRHILKSFYKVIKSSDEYLRFVFITGVSKFSRLSVFSDLNNLLDITLSDEFSTMLGYTEAELEHYFNAYMKPVAEKRGVPGKQLTQTIAKWYNGYSWDGENFVYNPFSVLNLLKTKRFKNFWFFSGTPTFLINLIKRKQSRIMDFENLPVKNYTFESYDIEKLEVPALLFQTGYLTVKKITYKDEEETYHLSYPNKEVRDSFLTHLFGEFAQGDTNSSTRLLERIGKTLELDDMERFIQELKTFFASIPFNIFIGDREAYYHSIIYLILRLNGAAITPEAPTNMGRIDAVVETGRKIYIMEFKMGSQQAAMAQIKRLRYYEKYLGRGKEVVLMGIGFDSKKRNIGGFLKENL